MNQIKSRLFKLISKILFFIFLLFLFSFFVLVIRDDFGHLRPALKRWPIFSFLVKERIHAQMMGKAWTLSFDEPSFEYLRKFIQGEAQELAGLEKYKNYYEKADKIFPDVADIQGTLGFCYYQLNQKEKALTAYKKATQLNPNSFWYQYNLGVIYFKNGLYDKTIELFQKALAANLRENIQMIFASNVNQQIFWPDPHFYHYPVELNLKEGYHNGYLLWALSLKALGKKEELKKFLRDHSLNIDEQKQFDVKLF